MKAQLFLIALVCVGLGTCQVFPEIKRGKCNSDLYHASVVDFDPIRYSGRWYETFRTDNTFQAKGECATALYTPNEEGNIIVENSQVNPDGSRYTNYGIALIAYPDDPEHHGILNVTIGGEGAISIPGISIFPNYRVLATDYDSYSLVWNCNPVSALLKIGKSCFSSSVKFEHSQK